MKNYLGPKYLVAALAVVIIILVFGLNISGARTRLGAMISGLDSADAVDSISLNTFNSNPSVRLNGNVQRFARQDINNSAVFHSQRMIDGAIVEKDQSVYVFDKTSGKLKTKKSLFRSGLPQHLPVGLMTKEKAETLVDGNKKFSSLYYMSPNSDIFPRNLYTTNPVWAVASYDSKNIESITVFDAVTGKKLGNAIPPPSSAFSTTGPTGFGPCYGAWDAWSNGATDWFKKMGYKTDNQVWGTRDQIMAAIQNNNYPLFYELDHGGSYGFTNSCAGGDLTSGVESSDIHNWIAGFSPKKFSFIGSCGGLCDTGSGTFAYEFQKGSATGTTAVGYCGMGDEICSTCWGYSIDWQNDLFSHMSQGQSVKDAFDQANTDYPACGMNKCMRFSGDPNFKVPLSPSVSAPTVYITFPSMGAYVSGRTGIYSQAYSDVTVVAYYKDGVLLGSAAGGANNFTWDTTKETDGPHTLQAKAYDSANNIGLSPSITVNVANKPSLHFTTPIAGEQWGIGSTYDVTWTGVSHGSKQYLALLVPGNSDTGNNFEYYLGTTNYGASNFSWTIASSTLPGLYKIALRGFADVGDLINVSPAFYINTPTLTLTSGTPGMTLYKDQSYNMTWTSTNIATSSTIAIWLQKAGNDYSYTGYFAKVDVPNTGKYALIIPSVIPDGDDYSLRFALAGQTITTTPKFSLRTAPVKPTITITDDPVPGTVLARGSNYTLTWNSSGISASTTLVITAQIAGNTVLTTTNLNNGRYNFTVPMNAPNASTYTLTITAPDGTSAKTSQFSVGDKEVSPALPVGANIFQLLFPWLNFRQ